MSKSDNVCITAPSFGKATLNSAVKSAIKAIGNTALVDTKQQGFNYWHKVPVYQYFINYILKTV